MLSAVLSKSTLDHCQLQRQSCAGGWQNAWTGTYHKSSGSHDFPHWVLKSHSSYATSIWECAHYVVGEIARMHSIYSASAVQLLCLAAGAVKDSIVGEERLVRHLLLELAHQPHYTGATYSNLLAVTVHLA